ncbi:MAG TPA: energy transducer TonB, partial [Chromatiales bacterium]|nr:energy transducer TonB [Chromatiales bacterium]
DDFVPATSLDVVLVTSPDQQLQAPEDATAIAQQNLRGAGNTDSPNQLKTAMVETRDAAAAGPDQDGSLEQRETGTTATTQATLITSIASDRTPVTPTRQGEPEPLQQRTAMPGTTRAVEIVNEPELQTLITASGPRELVISASTHESRIAAYLGAWKRKVERIGTLNYPRQLQTQGLSGSPVLEVAITADGRLKEVLVRQSSGHPTLDEAAMAILKLATPFDPFPEYLRDDYDVLRFAYEWRFDTDSGPGRVTAMTTR